MESPSPRSVCVVSDNFQVQYAYYRKALLTDVPFSCTKELKESRGGKRLQLDLCCKSVRVLCGCSSCSYTREGKSNMVVGEVETLTGYKYDTEEADKLLQGEMIRVRP